MDCIWVNLKNIYIKISFIQRENHSQLLCGLDFANDTSRHVPLVLLDQSDEELFMTRKRRKHRIACIILSSTL